MVHLEVASSELVRRLLERAAIEGRVDDTPEVIEKRLALYEQETAPLISYYRDRKILVQVDGAQSVDDVTRDILAGLDELAPPPETR